MRVYVVLERIDLKSGVHDVLADGPAILRQHHTLLYKEKGTGAKHQVTFGNESALIERNSDFTSVTVLRKDGTGTSTVDSEYGTLTISARVKEITKTTDQWIAEYEILNGSETADHFKFIWHIAYMA